MVVIGAWHLQQHLAMRDWSLYTCIHSIYKAFQLKLVLRSNALQMAALAGYPIPRHVKVCDVSHHWPLRHLLSPARLRRVGAPNAIAVKSAASSKDPVSPQPCTKIAGCLGQEACVASLPCWNHQSAMLKGRGRLSR